jgi:hypothetical protein
MKKLLFISLALILLITQLTAQKSTFNKGDKVLNLGLGLGATYYGGYYTSRMPSLTGSFEVCVVDGLIENKGSIGVGGYVGFSSAKYENYYKTTNFVFGARGSFHYPLVEKLDTYTGLLLGYNIFSYNYYDSSTPPYTGSTSGLASAWYIGARYYFNEKFSAMAELGYGVSVLTLGLGIKF